MSIDYSKFQIEEAPDYSDLLNSNNNLPNPEKSDEEDQGDSQESNEGDGDEDQEDSIVSPSLYKTVLSTFATREGVEVPDDLEIKNALEFEEKLEEIVIKNRLKKKEQERYADASPEVKLFLNIREYFDDDTQAISFARTKSALEGFTDEQLEDEDLQKTIYLDYLTSIKNMTKEEADEEIEEAETLGKLREKADNAKSKIVNHLNDQINQFKVHRSSKEKNDIEIATKKFETLIDGFKSIESAGELKITDELKKKMKENLIKVVHVEGKKSFNDFALKQHKHSDEITLAIEYFNTLGLFNVDSKTGKWTPDFSKLSKLSAKNIKNKLDEVIVEGQRVGKVGVSEPLNNKAKIKELGYDV